MRAGARALAAALVVMGACTGDDGARSGPPTAPAPPASATSTAPSITAATSVPPASRPAGPSGSVTLSARDVSLPDTRAGGTGLRVLVRAASPRLTVHRTGGAGGMEACPVAGPVAALPTGGCTDLRSDGTVELPFLGGVALRATGPAATAAEVAVVYVPADRTTTLVTPDRPAGACEATACSTTFSLTPGRAGELVVDGRAGGGRHRLVLESVGAAGAGGGASNKTLATVEGGGTLSIRSTLEAGREAVLLHQEQGPGPVAALTAEVSWP